MTYRDAMDAAAGRIAQLQEELATLPPAPRRPWPVAVGVGVMAALLLGGSGWLARPRPVLPAAPPMSAVSEHLELLPRSAPLLVDLNGDGVDDVVVAMLDPADRRTALRVTAFDGRSLALAWRSVGLPGTRSATRIGLGKSAGAVVVRDENGAVTLLDAKTGAQRANGAFEVGCIGSGCPPEAGEGVPSSYRTARLAARSRHEAVDAVVFFGVSRGDRGVPKPYAEVRSPTSDVLFWEGELTKPGDTVVLGEMRAAVADATIFAAYSDASALITLTATQAHTRSHLWAARVRTTYGATLRTVQVARGRIYVQTDVAVDVYETGGKHVGSIAATP